MSPFGVFLMPVLAVQTLAQAVALMLFAGAARSGITLVLGLSGYGAGAEATAGVCSLRCVNRREDGMDLARFAGLDIVLVCGLPGSGKSLFAETFFRDSGRKRVNRKEIRRLLFEMTSFGSPWSESKFSSVDEILVKHVERKIIEHLLQNRQKILVDNTSVSADSRKAYLAIARQMHRTAGVIFLGTPIQTCLERNRRRGDPVPETVLSNLAAALDPPKAEEGFDQLLVVPEY